ncbi:hypothetical protein QQS21_005785 [Conoideocrella luteorostrata]|uniref:DUF924-domain-containing protein n=1 Tax=Conoideocrella luteorostrata TaxID=1105319 RepID=A0AAJ0G0N1_9HYPO|nr:hypothetical protein QQS21_005785 [Conoideocrella luteorostrata]
MIKSSRAVLRLPRTPIEPPVKYCARTTQSAKRVPFCPPTAATTHHPSLPFQTRLFTSSSGAFTKAAVAKPPSQEKKDAVLKSLITPSLLHEIQEFWFPDAKPESSIHVRQEHLSRWFAGGEALDKVCVERFLPTLEALRKINLKSGSSLIDAVQPADPCDWMRLLLLLDQLPRNCYRGTSAAIVFTEFDPLARDIAHAAIQRGIPDQTPQIRWQFAYRPWFYMPLMHSEEMGDHEIALEGFRRSAADVESLARGEQVSGSSEADEYRARALQVVRANAEAATELARKNLGFEQMHADIIRRFGRYPHRNMALGREPTQEEREYLENGGETFSP